LKLYHHHMSLLQAIILGIVQGLTEFLPISSSGHLILVPYLFNWDLQPLYFDVALHWGTLLAVLAYFWKDWKDIFQSVAESAKTRKPDFFQYPLETRLGLLIGIGTVPAVIIGFLFQSFIEDTLRSPYVVITMLVLVAIFMWWVEHKPKVVRKLKSLKIIDGFLIGIAQALALIPGTSRSGITISTGIFRGLSREDAARFSFLLSTPIIFGAGLYETIKVINEGVSDINLVTLGVGLLTSAVVGFLAIKFLMNFIRNKKLTLFVIYRVSLAVIILVLLIFNSKP
jgi:undecaprenyl-diphosphatase